MTWVKAAFGLIALINWVMSRLDETEKAKALAALWEQEFMKRDKEIREQARQARARAEAMFTDDPNALREPDPYSRS